MPKQSSTPFATSQENHLDTVTGSDRMEAIPSLDPLEGLPPLIPVPRAAKLLGLSRSAAYRNAAIGDLPARKLGGRTYIVTALLRKIITEADQPKSEAA